MLFSCNGFATENNELAKNKLNTMNSSEIEEAFRNVTFDSTSIPELLPSNARSSDEVMSEVVNVHAQSKFDEYEDDFRFIASKGVIPDTISKEWENSLTNCWLNTRAPLYYKFDKSIESIHPHNNLLIVELYSCYKGEIYDSRLDDVYYKLENYCETNNGISDIPVVFMWADDDGVLPYAYDPDAFKKAKNNSDFIVSWGTVPIFADEDERLQWSEAVWEARYINKLQPYIGEPVIIYGFVEKGAYIEVGINKNILEKVNGSVIEEIYQIIDEHYEENGINEIPVVFAWSEPFILSAAILDETPKWMENTIINLSIEERVDVTNRNETPGFTSSMLVLCLLILIRFRK